MLKIILLDLRTLKLRYSDNLRRKTLLGLHQDIPLLDWLQQYTFPTEHKFKDISYGEKIYPAVIKSTLSRGTTTASYFGSIHPETTLVLAKEAKEQGQRAFIGKVNMDTNVVAQYYEEDSVQQSIKVSSKKYGNFVKQVWLT